jgi:hypothetical protein
MKRLLVASFLLSALYSNQARAQFTDAHNYDNGPVGLNQIELSFAYVHANASIDNAVIVAGAKLNLNQGMVSYTRYFGLANHMMWASAAVPLASLSGEVAGTSIQGSVAGAGDSSYQVGALLKGGPALGVAQFEDYKARTILGVSLSVTAPTGLYHANKILNLGADRWSLKPEIALSYPFGFGQKWQLDAYANAYFYSDNTSYHGREVLRQEPLPGVEGHISYSFTDKLWASLDTRYSFRANTLVDGADQGNAQRNFLLGSEMNVSINSRHSLLLEFTKALVHQNGPALVGFAVKYNYVWGKGY